MSDYSPPTVDELRDMLAAWGMRQARAAEVLDMSRGGVSRWLAGTSPVPWPSLCTLGQSAGLHLRMTTWRDDAARGVAPDTAADVLGDVRNILSAMLDGERRGPMAARIRGAMQRIDAVIEPSPGEPGGYHVLGAAAAPVALGSHRRDASCAPSVPQTQDCLTRPSE